MTFREYYFELRKQPQELPPAEKFLIAISKLTGRSQKTVKQWVSGCQPVPNHLKRRIAGAMGIEVTELFPT